MEGRGGREDRVISTWRIAREGREGTVSSPATARPPSLSTRRGRDRFLGRGRRRQGGGEAPDPVLHVVLQGCGPVEEDRLQEQRVKLAG